MSQSPTWWRVLVLSAMVMCIAFALRASGASDKGITFATVDVQKINDNYKLKAVLETQFQQLQAKWQGRLARRQNMPLLTEDEQKQIDAIEDKGPNQTDADKATLKQLTDKAQQLNNQLVADMKWRYYGVEKLEKLPHDFKEKIKDTLLLHSFSIEELERRQKAFMEPWQEMKPMIEEQVQMSFDEMLQMV